MFPFPGGIEALPNGTLLLSIGAALLYFIVMETEPSLMRSAVKTISTALLALLAYMEGGPLLLVLALALSSAGDAFLSRNGDTAFLGGLASFLAAHIAYIMLFAQTGEGLAILSAEPWRGLVAALAALTTLGVLFILMRRVPPTLRLPVVAYSAAILGMGVMALTTRIPLVILGALLFMASDTLLGWERFVAPAISSSRRAMRIGVWAFYYAAQLLIVLGFLLAD
jgi:uncharacterized membrane protein YhhN